MSALTKIEKAGFKVFMNGENLGITPAKDLTLPQREFLKSHKAEIITELSTYRKVINWLASIGEAEQAIIDETIERCKTDPDTLSYFLQRANGTTRPH
jgi:phage tail sheath protein FI